MSVPSSTPGVTRWCMLMVAIVSVVAAICAGSELVKAESTGTAR